MWLLFIAKIDWKRPRKTENKNYSSISFLTRLVIENSKKIEKKFRKFKNTIVASFQAIIGWNSRETGKIKIIIPFRSNPTRHRKFIRNCKKIQKLKKIQLWLLFKQNLVGKGREREKIQIIVSFRSYPMGNRKFHRYSQKIQKN